MGQLANRLMAIVLCAGATLLSRPLAAHAEDGDQAADGADAAWVAEHLNSGTAADRLRAWTRAPSLAAAGDTQIVPALGAALDDPDTSVRVAALHLLSKYASVPEAVIASLYSMDDSRPEAAIAAWTIAAVDSDVERVKERLWGLSRASREGVLSGWTSARRAEAIPTIAEVLRDESGDYRQMGSALRAISGIGARDRTAAAFLSSWLDEHAGPGLVWALEAYATVAVVDDAVDDLVRRARSGAYGPVGSWLRQSLAATGPEGVSAIAAAVENADGELRVEMVRALFEIGEPADRALPAIRSALDDADRGVELVAMLHRLGAVGVAEARRRLRSEHAGQRAAAAAAIWASSSADREDLEAAVSILGDDSLELRVQVGQAIEAADEGALELAAPALVGAFVVGGDDVRFSILRALRRIPEVARPLVAERRDALASSMRGADADREAIIEMIGLAGAAGDDVILDALESDAPELQDAATRAVSRLRSVSRGVSDWIVRQMRSRPSYVLRERLAFAAGGGPVESLVSLRELVEDGDPETRRAAADAICVMAGRHPREVAPVLPSLLASEDSILVHAGVRGTAAARFPASSLRPYLRHVGSECEVGCDARMRLAVAGGEPLGGAVRLLTDDDPIVAAEARKLFAGRTALGARWWLEDAAKGPDKVLAKAASELLAEVSSSER